MSKEDFSTSYFITDLSRRIPEDHEVISGQEGTKYANRADDRSVNYSMVARDITERFGLNEENRILEVCAGAGQLANALYEQTGSRLITATDGGQELIEAARQRYAHTPILFEVQNVHTHAYQGKADVVVCKDSFHHFENPHKALEELLHLAKPGGSVYIYDLSRDAPADQIEGRIMALENEHEKTRALQSLNASYTLGEMEDILMGSSAIGHAIIDPLKFSEENLEFHRAQLDASPVKEHEFDRLSRISIADRAFGYVPC